MGTPYKLYCKLLSSDSALGWKANSVTAIANAQHPRAPSRLPNLIVSREEWPTVSNKLLQTDRQMKQRQDVVFVVEQLLLSHRVREAFS